MEEEFRLLFVYPNSPLLNPPPVSIATFAALLRNEDVKVKVFDTTFYQEAEVTSDKTREENLQVRPFSFEGYDLPLQVSTPGEDLKTLVEEYQPHLIGISVLEGTWNLAEELLNAIANTNVPVIVGGAFATFAPEIVLEHPAVTMICRGEGEGAIVELCCRLRRKESIEDVRNLWIKRIDGSIIRNPMRKVVDINQIPIPDYSLFHPARLLRPWAGRVCRTVPLETNRGCSYSCTFCNSPTTAKFYRDAGAGVFFRKKSIDRIQEELRHLIQGLDPEYVYFLSDTFLSMTDSEFDQFVKMYSEFRLPFWIQSRAETVTPYRVRKLKEIGCHRMSMGLEHGNPEFRRKILKKKFSNLQMIKAAKIIAEVGIPLTVNNIIGFPGETRELVFDTIELNRQIPYDTTNAFAFIPFHGTPLHRQCVEKGYIKERDTAGCFSIDTPLDMPQFCREEIAGLRKTFALYARMPKEYWPEIEKAESDDEDGQAAFRRLRKIYSEKYFKERISGADEP